MSFKKPTTFYWPTIFYSMKSIQKNFDFEVTQGHFPSQNGQSETYFMNMKKNVCTLAKLTSGMT